MITHVANDSNLRFAGIQEGDLVLAGMDRVVHDARSWKRVLDEESAALARDGGTLVLKVKRGDSPAIDTRLRIARGGAASDRLVEQAAPDPRAPLVVVVEHSRTRTRPATSGTTIRKSESRSHGGLATEMMLALRLAWCARWR